MNENDEAKRAREIEYARAELDAADHREEFLNAAIGALHELEGKWKLGESPYDSMPHKDMARYGEGPGGMRLLFRLHGPERRDKEYRIEVSGAYSRELENFQCRNCHIPKEDFPEGARPGMKMAYEIAINKPGSLAKSIKSRLLPGYTKVFNYVVERYAEWNDRNAKRDSLIKELAELMGGKASFTDYRGEPKAEPNISLYHDVPHANQFNVSGEVTVKSSTIDFDRFDCNYELGKRICKVIGEYLHEKAFDEKFKETLEEDGGEGGDSTI